MTKPRLWSKAEMAEKKYNSLYRYSGEEYKKHFFQIFEEANRNDHREFCLSLILKLDFDDRKLNLLLKVFSEGGLKSVDDGVLISHLDKHKLTIFDVYLLIVHLIQRNNLTMIKWVVENGLYVRCARSLVSSRYWSSVKINPCLDISFYLVPGFVKKMTRLSKRLGKHFTYGDAKAYFDSIERFGISPLSIANHFNRPEIFQYIYSHHQYANNIPFFVQTEKFMPQFHQSLRVDELLRSGIISLLDQAMLSDALKEIKIVDKLVRYQHFPLVERYLDSLQINTSRPKKSSSHQVDMYLDEHSLEYYYLSDKESCLSIIFRLYQFDDLFRFAIKRNYLDVLSLCLRYPAQQPDFMILIQSAFNYHNTDTFKCILSEIQFDEIDSDRVMNQALNENYSFAKIAYELLEYITNINLYRLIECAQKEKDDLFARSLIDYYDCLPEAVLDKCLQIELTRMNQGMINFLYSKGARPLCLTHTKSSLSMLPHPFEYRVKMDRVDKFECIFLKTMSTSTDQSNLASISNVAKEGTELQDLSLSSTMVFSIDSYFVSGLSPLISSRRSFSSIVSSGGASTETITDKKSKKYL